MPDGQFNWHTLIFKFIVLHDVQLFCVIIHVAQSPLHNNACPDILTYPGGTVAKHYPFKNTYPILHF